MATNRFDPKESLWTPKEIYDVSPGTAVEIYANNFGQGSDGVEISKVDQAREEGSQTFGQKLIGGIAGSMRNVFTRNTIPPVKVEPLFNPIQTNLEQALEPIFEDFQDGIDASKAKGEQLAALIEEQKATMLKLEDVDAQITKRIEQSGGVNDSLEALRVELQKEIQAQGNIINDMEALLDDFDGLVEGSVPFEEAQKRVNDLQMILWGSQNRINMDNQQQWSEQGLLNKLQEEMWSSQGKFNGLVQEFMVTQATVDELQNQRASDMEQSMIALREAITEQGEYISRMMFVPSGQDVEDSYLSVVKETAYPRRTFATAKGDWIGYMVVQGVADRGSTDDDNDVPISMRSPVPNSSTTPRVTDLSSYANSNMIIHYWVSRDRAVSSDKAINANFVAKTGGSWTRIDDLNFTVEKESWHSLGFIVTWDAATFHDYYSMRINRVRSGSESTLKILGPQKGVGPLIDNGNGVRTRSISVEVGKGGLLPGDVVTFDIASTGQYDSQRTIRYAKRMVTWRVTPS